MIIIEKRGVVVFVSSFIGSTHDPGPSIHDVDACDVLLFKNPRDTVEVIRKRLFLCSLRRQFVSTTICGMAFVLLFITDITGIKTFLDRLLKPSF